MSQRVLRHPDGSVETWDDDTGNYSLLDATGATTTRALTSAEQTMLNPNKVALANQDATLRQVIATSLDNLILQILTASMQSRLNRLWQAGKLGDAALVRAVNKGYITDAQRQQIEATPPGTTV